MKTTSSATLRLTKKRAAPKQERVLLERPHEHLGVMYPKGHTLTVHPKTAEWLRAAGVVPQLEKE